MLKKYILRFLGKKALNLSISNKNQYKMSGIKETYEEMLKAFRLKRTADKTKAELEMLVEEGEAVSRFALKAVFSGEAEKINADERLEEILLRCDKLRARMKKIADEMEDMVHEIKIKNLMKD